MTTSTTKAMPLDSTSGPTWSPEKAVSVNDLFKKIHIAVKRTTRVITEAKMIAAALASAAVSVAGVLNIDSDLVSNLAEAFHGSSAHMSKNTKVAVFAKGKVKPLTMEACHFNDVPGETQHLAYLLIEGDGLSHTTPFVLVRKNCTSRDLEGSVWISPTDLASLSSELDNAPINELDVYVTYTRAELFGLEYLLEKSAKTEIGATNQ